MKFKSGEKILKQVNRRPGLYSYLFRSYKPKDTKRIVGILSMRKCRTIGLTIFYAGDRSVGEGVLYEL